MTRCLDSVSDAVVSSVLRFLTYISHTEMLSMRIWVRTAHTKDRVALCDTNAVQPDNLSHGPEPQPPTLANASHSLCLVMDPDRKQMRPQVERRVEVSHEIRHRAMSVAGGEAELAGINASECSGSGSQSRRCETSSCPVTAIPLSGKYRSGHREQYIRENYLAS